MRILALNTAFSNSDVAYNFDDKIEFMTLPSSAKQSENILSCVDEILKKHNIKINEFDCMSCVVGPGSFTGVRIGIALIKGMTLAKPSLKLISICSLDLMAHIAKKENSKNEFWCVLNALSGNIFACKYNIDGTRITEPKMFTGDELNSLTGDVYGLKTENMEMANKFISLTTEALLDYSILLYNNNNFCKENEFLPIYLRKSQAECQLEKKNGN